MDGDSLLFAVNESWLFLPRPAVFRYAEPPT